jgi:hypothetical protein
MGIYELVFDNWDGVDSELRLASRWWRVWMNGLECYSTRFTVKGHFSYGHDYLMA